MRIFIISFILFGFSFLVEAQTKTFMSVLGGSGYDEGIASFPTSDNGYLLLGNTGSYGNGNSDVWVVKLDSLGKFVWQQFYGTWAVEKISNAIQTKDGNFYMVGYTNQNYSQSYNIYVLGIKENGATIFEKNLGGEDWDFGNSLVQDSDSSITILCQTQSYNQLTPKIMLWKLSLNGDSLDSKIMNTSTFDKGNEIKSLDNKSYFVGGYSQSGFNQKKVPLLMNLDSNFNIIWQKTFPFYLDAEISTLVTNPDSTTAFAGYFTDSISLLKQNWIVLTDKNGEILWERIYNQSNECQVNRIERLQNGNYLIAGTTKIYGMGDNEFHIYFINDGGWYLSGSTFGSSKSDIPNQLFVDKNHSNSILITGLSENKVLSKSSYFIVKADSNLYADTNIIAQLISSIELNSKEEIKYYPNPVKDKLMLDISGYSEAIQKIELFDIQGILMEELEVSQNENNVLKFDLGMQKNGVYFIRITSKSKVVTKKMIVLK